MRDFSMSSPGLGITISQPVQWDESGDETALPFRDVEIAGNRSGLLKLAELIRNVAESGRAGYHIHIDPDDTPSLLRSRDFSVTITLNSTKDSASR